jgi:pimeloyl-ACP methyl ester carboxylesterase
MPSSVPLPANIESREINIKGRRIHYLQFGQGKPVVLLHGGASDSREWQPLMRYSASRPGEACYAFYAPDLPGFGESARDEKGYYLPDFTGFLLGFIDLLKLGRPALAGHSFGARVCLDAAAQPGTDISKLILIDASGLGKVSLFGRFLFAFFGVLRTILRKPQPHPKFLTKEGVDWNYVGDDALKSLKIPTLLIWKNPDPYMPIRNARRAERLIPGAKLVVLNGYGHAPHQQKNNEPFNKVLLDFLDSAKN